MIWFIANNISAVTDFETKDSSWIMQWTLISVINPFFIPNIDGQIPTQLFHSKPKLSFTNSNMSSCASILYRKYIEEFFIFNKSNENKKLCFPTDICGFINLKWREFIVVRLEMVKNWLFKVWRKIFDSARHWIMVVSWRFLSQHCFDNDSYCWGIRHRCELF